MAACTPRLDLQEAPVPSAPQWVESRPMSGMYYTGIGVAQKSANVNFQRLARENALSDLASEIKVNVSTNSLLYTLEREYKFEQEFRETVRVSSNLELEDFEMVDSWEDDHSFWVYYRLSKQEYADRQRARRESAQNLALDFYAKGQAAETTHQFQPAADSYLRGLQALEAFWGEQNSIEFQGRNILIDNALFTSLRDLLSQVSIEVENGLELNYQNGFKTTASLRVADSQTSFPLEGVPLKYEYFGTFGRHRGKITTNADGRSEIPINDAEKERSTNVLVASVDTELLFEPFQSDRFMRRLTEPLRSASAQFPITYKAPTVQLISTEKNLGQAMSTSPLSAAIKTSLVRRGVRFLENGNGADLAMTIRSDTKSRGMEQGFYTTTLEIDIDIRNIATGERVYSVSRSDIRGVDLDYERAGMKAYQNITRNIESELMRRLVNDLF